MKNKISASLTVFLLLLPFFAHAQTKSGFRLVPCGASDQKACTFNDLMLVVVRLINLLFAAAGITAVSFILYASWEMVSSLGKPDRITKAKDGLYHAVIGFSIILLSFAFINFLLWLFGIKCSWWSYDSWKNTDSFYNACIK